MAASGVNDGTVVLSGAQTGAQCGAIMRVMVLPGDEGERVVTLWSTVRIVEVSRMLHPLSFNHPNYLSLAGLDPGYHYN